MSDNQPDDFRTDLPPLPELKSLPEDSEPSREFVPPPFTSELLAALREKPEKFKQDLLAIERARRRQVSDESGFAKAIGVRLAQIIAAVGAMDAGAQPSAGGSIQHERVAEGAMEDPQDLLRLPPGMDSPDPVDGKDR